MGTPGYEVDLLYVACLLTLVLGGTGPLSFDLFFAKLKTKHPMATTE